MLICQTVAFMCTCTVLTWIQLHIHTKMVTFTWTDKHAFMLYIFRTNRWEAAIAWPPRLNHYRLIVGLIKTHHNVPLNRTFCSCYNFWKKRLQSKRKLDCVTFVCQRTWGWQNNYNCIICFLRWESRWKIKGTVTASFFNN